MEIDKREIPCDHYDCRRKFSISIGKNNKYSNECDTAAAVATVAAMAGKSIADQNAES